MALAPDTTIGADTVMMDCAVTAFPGTTVMVGFGGATGAPFSVA